MFCYSVVSEERILCDGWNLETTPHHNRTPNLLQILGPYYLALTNIDD